MAVEPTAGGLQTSGRVWLSNIQTEFGGVDPVRMSEYYGAAGGVPQSSGTLSRGCTPAPCPRRPTG